MTLEEKWSELKAICEAKELRLLDHGKGHWQIVGGPKIVNFYPQSAAETVFVQGGKQGQTGRGMTLLEIAELTFK